MDKHLFKKKQRSVFFYLKSRLNYNLRNQLCFAATKAFCFSFLLAYLPTNGNSAVFKAMSATKIP